MSLLGFLGGLFSGAGASAMNMASSAISTKQQYNYNKALQKDTFGYNRTLQEDQFKYNRKLQADTYNYDVKLQNLQNQFTTNMSNTAHQREVADLRAAGLNPILSATGGNGATTPTAGSATVSGAQVSGTSVPGTSVDAPKYDPVGTYLAFRQQKNMNDTAAAQVWRDRKQASLFGEQARNEAEKYDNIGAERMWTKQQIENSKAITKAQVYSLMKNADANYLNSAGNAYFNTVRAKNESYDANYKKMRSDYYGSGFGKATGLSKEMLKNVPFFGKFSY